MKKLNSKFANTALSIGIGAAAGALGGAVSPALTRAVPNTTQRAVMGAQAVGSGMAVVSGLNGLFGPRRRRKMQEETIKQFYKNRLNEALQYLELKEGGLQRYKRMARGAVKRLNALKGPSDRVSLNPKVPNPRWSSMIPGEEVWDIKDPVHRAAQDQFRKDMAILKGMKGSFSKPSRFEIRRASSESRGAKRIVRHILGKPGPAGIKKKTGKNIRATVQGHQMDWYRLGSMIDDNVTGKASQPWKQGPVG